MSHAILRVKIVYSEYIKTRQRFGHNSVQNSQMFHYKIHNTKNRYLFATVLDGKPKHSPGVVVTILIASADNALDFWARAHPRNPTDCCGFRLVYVTE